MSSTPSPGGHTSAFPRRAFLAFAAGALLSAVTAAWMLQLWRADLRVPLGYTRDALSASVYIKGMLDTGWYTRNGLLGAPWGMVLYDYPSLHTIHFVIMKGMAPFLRDYASLMNGYYLLTFPLVALAAMSALRQLSIAYPVAVAGAVLYSVAPYHFGLGGIRELFLSAYFAVPLAVMMAWWVASGREATEGPGTASTNRFLRWPRVIWSLLVCLFIALSHIYYVVFSVFIILVSGTWSALARRRAVPFLCALAVCSVIGAVVLANHLPVLSHARSSGLSPAAVERDVGGPLRHGLRIASLLIPTTSHGVTWLEALRRSHTDALQSEVVRGGAYLGAVGVIGFVLLLVQLILAVAGRIPEARMALLSVLNLALLLLAVVGGFGYGLGLATFPIIRYYSRVSVYISFLSVAAVFLLVDRLTRGFSAARSGVFASAIVLSVLVVGGVVDQRPTADVPDYDQIETQYRIDAAFVAAIERSLPDSAMVFQMPHVSFPEGTGRYRMKPYDPATMYLHSASLKWSFGAMRGRPGTLWLERVAERPTRSFLEGLCLLGFGGVCVERDGYADDGGDLVGELSKFLRGGRFESKDGKRVFFTLVGYRDSLRDSLRRSEWEARRAKEHLLLVGSSGLGDALLLPSSKWHWCEPTGELIVHNLSDRAIRCQIAFLARTPHVESADLVVECCPTAHRLQMTSKAQRFLVTVVLGPGENLFRFRTDAPSAVSSQGDYRAFALFGPQLLRVGWGEKSQPLATRTNTSRWYEERRSHVDSVVGCGEAA